MKKTDLDKYRDDAVTQYLEGKSTPYIDDVEEGYLDENFNLVTKDEIMKNNNANLVGNRQGLKKYLGNKLTSKQYQELVSIFDGEVLEMTESYAGKVGFVLATEMSSNEGIQRIKQVFREGGINLDEIMPDGPNINPNYYFYGQRILERLSRILEEK